MPQSVYGLAVYGKNKYGSEPKSIYGKAIYGVNKYNSGVRVEETVTMEEMVKIIQKGKEMLSISFKSQDFESTIRILTRSMCTIISEYRIILSSENLKAEFRNLLILTAMGHIVFCDCLLCREELKALILEDMFLMKKFVKSNPGSLSIDPVFEKERKEQEQNPIGKMFREFRRNSPEKFFNMCANVFCPCEIEFQRIFDFADIGQLLRNFMLNQIIVHLVFSKNPDCGCREKVKGILLENLPKIIEGI